MSNVRKYPRTTLGSIVKAKKEDGAKFAAMYVKVRLPQNETITLRDGDYINVETPGFQLENVDRLEKKGILSPENAEKARTRIQEGIDKRVASSKDGVDFVVAELVIKNN